MKHTVRRVAFVSPLGGSGQTTVVANFASLWSADGPGCLALDLCPQNSLCLHLGMYLGLALDMPDGWAPLAMTGDWWAYATLENSAGVRFVPFGQGTQGQPVATALNRMLEQDTRWLATQLQAIALEEDSLVLLDVPPWPQPLAAQALACADLVVVCLDASPRSARLQSQIKALLAQARPGAALALLATRFSPRRDSQCAALETLQQQWPDLLCPYVLHEDESASAALAAAHCVTAFAPQAQSAHDLHGIAHWLLARCPQDPYP
jgi:cellulose synthase operon protein YhjQ